MRNQLPRITINLTNHRSRRQSNQGRDRSAFARAVASARRMCLKLLAKLTQALRLHHASMRTSKTYRDSFRRAAKSLIDRMPAGNLRTIADLLQRAYFGSYDFGWGH